MSELEPKVPFCMLRKLQRLKVTSTIDADYFVSVTGATKDGTSRHELSIMSDIN